MIPLDPGQAGVVVTVTVLFFTSYARVAVFMIMSDFTPLWLC